MAPVAPPPGGGEVAEGAALAPPSGGACRRPSPIVAGLVVSLSLVAVAAPATTAEVTVLCPRAVEHAVGGVAEEFRAESGTRVRLVLGTAGALARQAAAGEVADVLIGTATGLADLERRGTVAAGSRVDLGRVGVGVAVRAGAPRPDISTPEALRAALLAATSLGYADPARGGTGGTHFASVLARLGLAEAVRAKTRLFPQGVQALEAVARGEIELAVTPISEIVIREGLALVGPLPGDLQSPLSYAAALLAGAPDGAAGRAFLARLVSPGGRARFAAAGFER